MRFEHGCSLRACCLAAGLTLLSSGGTAYAQSPPAFDNPLSIPDLTHLVPTATDPAGVSASLQILVLLTVLTLVPSILVMMTAFPRIVIVLALLRQAVGTPQLPPGQILLGLSLFMTMLVMAPTWHKIQTQAATPYFDGQMGQREAVEIAVGQLKDFIYRQIYQAGSHAGVYLFL